MERTGREEDAHIVDVVRAVFDFATVLVIVDQSASIGALPLAVARDPAVIADGRRKLVEAIRPKEAPRPRRRAEPSG